MASSRQVLAHRRLVAFPAATVFLSPKTDPVGNTMESDSPSEERTQWNIPNTHTHCTSISCSPDCHPQPLPTQASRLSRDDLNDDTGGRNTSTLAIFFSLLLDRLSFPSSYHTHTSGYTLFLLLNVIHTSVEIARIYLSGYISLRRTLAPCEARILYNIHTSFSLCTSHHKESRIPIFFRL